MTNQDIIPNPSGIKRTIQRSRIIPDGGGRNASYSLNREELVEITIKNNKSGWTRKKIAKTEQPERKNLFLETHLNPK